MRRTVDISVLNTVIIVAAGCRHHTGSGISDLSVSYGIEGTGLIITGNLIHFTGEICRASLRNTARDVI